jgi:transcriptional regulator with XRE-family HTH domain/KaiC/GvpD/RAD55 family RecA-like ATPase
MMFFPSGRCRWQEPALTPDPSGPIVKAAVPGQLPLAVTRPATAFAKGSDKDQAMAVRYARISTGLPALDRLVGSLAIGENVLWYDEAGSLAFPFCRQFIRESLARKRPLVYVSFDRSPKNLLQALGSVAETPSMTILDCFTNGKGGSSDIFTAFYHKDGAQWPYQIIHVQRPSEPEQVAEAMDSLWQTLSGNVCFIFESLTGMQALWGGEEAINRFYTHSCPKLYELETVAYWIIEKNAHSDRLKASINQIAQVVVDLSMDGGKPCLSLLKAERRRTDRLNSPHPFWSDGQTVGFESGAPIEGSLDLGSRIKGYRTELGLSQKELAELVEVSPSTISQLESNSSLPSLPGLFKIAEALNVQAASVLAGDRQQEAPVYPFSRATPVPFKDLAKEVIRGWRLTPLDLEAAAVPYLLEIAPGQSLQDHFFRHKGEEVGYLLSGRLSMHISQTRYEIAAGETVVLKRDIPSQWENPAEEPARLLWLTIR